MLNPTDTRVSMDASGVEAIDDASEMGTLAPGIARGTVVVVVAVVVVVVAVGVAVGLVGIGVLGLCGD